MGYKINYEKNIEMNLKANAIMQECIDALDTAEEILNRIKETEAIKCKAKSSLNGYMEDVIINRMISTTREAIQCYMLEQVCYIFEMYEHDDSETAIIEEDHLEDVISGLAEHYGVTEETIGGYRTVADGVSDIISLYTKAPDDMGNAYAGLKEKTEKTKNIFGEYQQRFEGRSGKLAEYIMECYNIVSQCSCSDISMTEYDGAYAGIPGVEALDSARTELITDIGYTDEEIAAACEKYEEITTAYIRRKEGEAKVRCLSGIILGGLSLLCPLTMSFTMPQLVVTYSLSSICVVYNTDQFLQGMQLLDAAETRNTDAEIDKMVDFHNETLNRGYETIGKISTAYCGTLVMGTLTQSLGGESVTFASVTKETGEDLLTDYMAGNIDEALGGGPLSSILISSILSVGINKAQKKIKGGGGKGAVDAIDATDVRNVVNDIDVTDVTSGKYSLMGEMTDADGKAYERFLREGPQEGLTQAEIMGVYKADKQTALNARSQYAVSGKGIEGGTSSVQTEFNKLLNSDYYKKDFGYDCSEIAQDFYDVAGQNGKIYRIEGKNGCIKGYEYDYKVEYVYHEVNYSQVSGHKKV